MLPDVPIVACLPDIFERFVVRRLAFHGQLPESSIGKASQEPFGAVAVLPLKGVMLKEADAIDEYLGAVGMRDFGTLVNNAANDPNVKSIVILADSPGGSVDGLEELGAIVKSAAEKKNTITVIDGMAASAMYYIASQTREIIAGPSDLVGSIGTKLIMFDMSKMAEDAGIRVVPIDTGEFKSTGEPGTPLTDNQKNYLQGIVNFYFRDFAAKVRDGRGMDADAFAAVSDGRLFPAPQAKALGLVDKIARPNDAIAGLVAKYVSKPRMAAMELRRKYI